MPATTRSGKKQATLEDVGAGTIKSAKPDDSAGSNANQTSKKRKATTDANESSQSERATKKAKAAPKTEESGQNESAIITINRAPVLELWSASVAHFIHPQLSWNTCLSIGGAVSTLAAISKGRSIGTMSKPDPGGAEEKRRQRQAKAADQGLKEVEIMSFHLRFDDHGIALVGDKPRKAGEEALRKKYGDVGYQQAGRAFADALQAWKGREDELNARAFHMYEDFRPSVPPGRKGWGRQGKLDLQMVKDVIGAGA